jgi:UDP-N-acetylglucosamine transferase subunit ALG13
MIFITVGTTPFPFFRMIDVVKNIIDQRKNNEKIIFQCGNTPCMLKSKNVFVRQSLKYTDIQKYMREARVIISHGGPATIYQAFAAGKKPFIVPREKQYGEHVNDHQVYFCQTLFKEGKVILFNKENCHLPNGKVTQKLNIYKNITLPRVIQYLKSISV